MGGCRGLGHVAGRLAGEGEGRRWLTEDIHGDRALVVDGLFCQHFGIAVLYPALSRASHRVVGKRERLAGLDVDRRRVGAGLAAGVAAQVVGRECCPLAAVCRLLPRGGSTYTSPASCS